MKERRERKQARTQDERKRIQQTKELLLRLENETRCSRDFNENDLKNGAFQTFFAAPDCLR